MKRTATLLVVAALLVASAAAVPVSGLSAPGPTAADTGETTDAANGTDEHNETGGNASDVPPGAMLSGVLGVQEAELEGEVETRAFDIRVARAATDPSRADVVLAEVGNVERRIQRLEQREEALRRARENGSISNATFEAELAELAARTATVRELANQSETVARGLPDDLLASKGIDVSAIKTLERHAANLTGPEVAAIARSIVGPDVGKSIARGRAPVDVGPPEATPGGNETADGAGQDGSDRGGSDQAGSGDGSDGASTDDDGEGGSGNAP